LNESGFPPFFETNFGGKMIVVYNRPNVHFAYGIKLIPGANHVDPKLWEIAKKDTEIQGFLKAGILTLAEPDTRVKSLADSETTEEDRQKATAKAFGDNPINPNAPPEDLSNMEPLTNFNEKKALALVEGTFKVEILQAWLSSETRFKVKRALEAQIQKMEDAGTSKAQEG
jgi:hypothetical protein